MTYDTLHLTPDTIRYLPSLLLHTVYSRLQNVNKLYLDSKLGPTLSGLVAAKKRLYSQISYFYTTTNPSNQVKMEEGEVKDVRWRKGRLRRDM